MYIHGRSSPCSVLLMCEKSAIPAKITSFDPHREVFIISTASTACDMVPGCILYIIYDTVAQLRKYPAAAATRHWYTSIMRDENLSNSKTYNIR